MSSIDDGVRLGVAELYAAYADCIDDDRLEEWPEFFVEQCRYLITDRQSYEAGLKHGVIYCASKGMLVDRVTSMRRVLMFEAHRYRHLVGPPRVLSVEGGIAESHANFYCARIMHNGETSLFATGRYLDRIDVSGRPYRFVERLVVLDSQKIHTLIAIPL
ncbi:MAG TPA: aromatic-ring-hydroxylating dioxygenase subunit beta [Stellaceae bacterium]|nr:aromatic-ring-hydroxylating dioxygenase subunit beta [Stellaceae bacterium]